MKKFLITIIFCFLTLFSFSSCFPFFLFQEETDIYPVQNTDPESSNIDISKYVFYTPNNSNYIDREPTEFEMSIINEINLFRSNPSDYFNKYIKPLASNYPNNSYYESCKSDLLSLSALNPYSYKKGLFRCAVDHVNTQGQTTEIGHDRTNGKDWNFCVKNCGSYTKAGENISYGVSDPRNIVINLLIDNGINGYGHRKNLMSSEFTSVGVAFGTHKGYRVMCVMDFGQNWTDK